MTRSTRFSSMPVVMLALVASAAPLASQSHTTSALAGRVADSSGSPLTGAVVRAASSVLIGGERVTRTTDNGSYRFALLPPGQYKVTVEYPGRQTATKTVLLELGLAATVNWRLVDIASATVEILAEAATVEAAQIGVTRNFSAEAIVSLPMERSLGGIMNLTPGVNSRQAWGGDFRENAYMMDGINVGDSMNNAQWIFPNMEWFEEIQVGGIGAPAEFSGFTGGYVNGLLKRGGNTFSGAFNAYYNDNKWEALNSNSDPRLTREDKILAPAKDWNISFSVGGPIIKDKVWFFASAERQAAENTPIGAPIPSKRNELRLLSKVTWQVTQESTLEALLEHDYTTHDRRGISRSRLPEATRKMESPNLSYGLTWTQIMGSDKVLTIKALGFDGHYEHLAYNGDSPGLRLTGSTQLLGGFNYFNNTHWTDYNGRSRNTIAATFDWFKSGVFSTNDSHAIRMGIEHEWITHEEREKIPGGVGLYGWVDRNGNVWIDDFFTGGAFDFKLRGTRLSAFVQDNWTVNDRLKLQPGIRFEQQKGNSVGRPTIWDTTTFAPRFGATVALTADQRNLFKFHWGRYYSSFVSAYIDRHHDGMMTPEAWYYWGDQDVIIDPYNPNTWPIPDPKDPSNEMYSYDVSKSETDPNAKQPYMDETVLSFEHKFKGPWTVSATYTHRVYKDNLMRINVTPDPDGEWRNYTFDDDRQNPMGEFTMPIWYSGLAGEDREWLVTTVPDAKRAYWSTSLVLTRQFQNNWGMNASYTKARRYGNTTRANGYDSVFESPNRLINAYGLLPGYNDDEIKINGMYEFPWKTRISAAFTYLSGERWTPIARTPRIPDRYWVFVETRGSRSYPSTSLLDIRLTQSFNITKTVKADVFVEVFNVLNEGAAYSWEDSIIWEGEFKWPLGVEPGRRPRLGLRISF